MPLMTCQTDCSNELHQLLVSVSKHLYLKKDGLITGRDEPFDVSLEKGRKTGKDHLVFYVLRDHFSGNFAYRITTINMLIPLVGFLHEIWSNENQNGVLWGLPKAVWVPRTIATPELFEGLKKLGVQPDYPPSGFASGIQAIKSIEESMYIWLLNSSVHTMENLADSTDEILDRMLWYSPKGDRREFWTKNLPEGQPLRPPVYETFVQAFSTSVSDRVLPLLPRNEDIKPAKRSGMPAASPEFSAEKLEQADALMGEAYEAVNREKALALAIKALKISPYCSDAYNLLARESESYHEKAKLYQKSVNAGRIALGESFFRENAGHFWLIMDTRPFMQAMAGLAHCLWKLKRTGEAIAIFQEMLHLNSSDNQGIRYLLLYALLEEDRTTEVAEHLREHNDGSTPFAYGRTLWSFCTAGPEGRSDDYLRDALKVNPFVPDYLLGNKYIPYPSPGYHGLGDESEAICYAEYAREAWKRRPAALDWLRSMTMK